MDHICAFISGTHRVLRNIRLDIAQSQVIACVQHTAISISASLYQVVFALLCCGNKHFRTIKMLCQQCLRYLRSKIPQVYDQRVASGFPDILQCLDHMDLALHDADRTLIDIPCIVLFAVRVHQCFSAVHG